ncbi:MAG: amidohydrolase family protein [Myxococcota bacterium]
MTHLIVVVNALLLSGTSSAKLPTYDVVIANGRVVDGTGAPWFVGDVGVVGDRIVAIGDLSSAPTKQRIDAKSLVVAPGFIDLQGQSELNVLADNRLASKVTQGVTTEITGEGVSIAPANEQVFASRWRDTAQKLGIALDWRTLDEYLKRLERAKPAANVGILVGAGGLRIHVMGSDNRPPTPAELDQMRQLLEQAMKEGAFGLSSALQYVPGVFATTEELTELAKVARRYNGVYFTHQRSEADRIFESLDEVVAIAKGANISTTIWHLKTAYPPNWGKMPEVLRRLAAARAAGVDVAASAYPYARSSNRIAACLPPWVSEGGGDKLVARLADPSQRARAKKEMDEAGADWENQWRGAGGGKGVMLSLVVTPELQKFVGKTFDEIGKELGKDPRDAAMDIAIADRGMSQVINAIMDEADVRAVSSDPLVSFGADSAATAEDGPLGAMRPHPRAFGTFPRVISEYVQRAPTMRMEEAVRKMTSLAASRVGLMDRGILRPGMMADIVVFDPASLKDLATYKEPNHYSSGVKHVLVNGKPIVRDGVITDARPGRALRGPGSRR